MVVLNATNQMGRSPHKPKIGLPTTRNLHGEQKYMFSLFYLIFVIPRYLYVDFENEELGCTNQQQFSAGGAGALPIYWDKVNIAHILPVHCPYIGNALPICWDRV